MYISTYIERHQQQNVKNILHYFVMQIALLEKLRLGRLGGLHEELDAVLHT